MTAKDIFNQITNQNALVNTSSYYFENNNTLIRVSDHLPKYYNILENNKDIEKIVLVLVDCNISDNELENYISELEKDIENCEIQGHIINNQEDLDLTINYLKAYSLI